MHIKSKIHKMKQKEVIVYVTTKYILQLKGKTEGVKMRNKTIMITIIQKIRMTRRS